MESERDLLAEALQAVAQVTGMPAEPVGDGRNAGIRLGSAGPFRVHWVGELGPNDVAEAARAHEPGEILVAERVTPKAAEALREQAIPFLDRAGNVFLQEGEVFLFITGRQGPSGAASKPAVRAFRPKGLQVIFALLCQSGLLNAAYRDIADRADVALGTVTGVMQDLEQLGYIRRAGRKRIWEDKGLLHEDWAKGFSRELRPRLNPRRYRVEDVDWWQRADPGAYGFRLGGEAAAARLTGYLRPQEVTLYGDGDFQALAADIRPVKDDSGNLEVLEPFWGDEMAEDWGVTVPPLLVYADLLAKPQARLQEVAAMIREDFLD
ncbi:type IV toxin-antitoxin system AbiEi family antitoxin [Thiohalorhabdus sp.]|uniref:type IV toxin-antitoxin system AbiEi family antitoxin n=1 Tax=Thiohalorhabdus sp. TaxID=3094134 RepID=UPI002FC3941D